ncbi:MAG: UDP-N-acetylmuramate dehydrogenase [Acidaminococcaceae bacterium]
MVLVNFSAWLREHKVGEVREAESMKLHTSFRIGGPADLLVIPQDASTLALIVAEAHRRALPLIILGNGSNVLVKDQGIRGVVVKLGNALKTITCIGTKLQAGAGLSLATVAAQAAKYSLTGMEFAVGIPGSIGGAVFMNAGAYDGTMQQIVSEVTVLKPDGSVAVLTPAELAFGYRTSSLQTSGYIVTEITLQLTQGESDIISAKMADFTKRRITKQPLDLPNAGSMFKRPVGNYAGTLIETTGLKGYQVGGAQVSTKHAGFVVNVGDATAADVLQLISEVQNKVLAASGVWLEPEVRVFGE